MALALLKLRPHNKSLCEFFQLCGYRTSDKESVLDTISRVANVHDTLCLDDVKSSLQIYVFIP